MTTTSTATTFDPVPRLAAQLQLPVRGVAAVVELLDDKATVPFIARYRKEKTGGLDEVQIRAIGEAREALLELEERRAAIIASVSSQGALTKELERALRAAATKTELEDLYLPFKQKRKTRASIARDRGLTDLADKIIDQGRSDPRKDAAAFVKGEVVDVDAALAGAQDIVAEAVADSQPVRQFVREAFAREGFVSTRKAKPKDPTPTRFDDYADYGEPLSRLPSHRVHAILRGESEGVLKVDIDVDASKLGPRLEQLVGIQRSSPWAPLYVEALKDAYKRLIVPSVENDLRATLKQKADIEAIDVFANNLDKLLLAPPLGPRAVVGIDPGLRTGCKCVAIDASGRFVETVTIYPSRGGAAEAEAATVLRAFVAKHKPFAVGIGNGTGGRETETFAKAALKDAAVTKDVVVVSVNEAGASVYSASDVARDEFPDLDLTIRGAISIARRLQDPLAELVKIDPKAIGVGSYQHDVDQPALAKKLDDVVESCVNRVGVDLNTASASLLQHVAGVGPALAKRIVGHREDNGLFTKRAQLKDVKGVGARTFEQAAGFVRVLGSEPLDASGVHPERYALVATMAKDLGVTPAELVGNAALAKTIDIKRYVDGDVGEPTLKDIVAELSKPGRDPRASFEAPRFRDDVTTMNDLHVGMVLSGVVTNVTAFGAFVDVGVHQDGLVHVSQLADRFVKNASDVVAPGDRLQVRVVEVDLQRKRIALSAKGLSSS